MNNHLQNETSPYLLKHAENPVDWYPWGEEAFDRAKDEDKPIFLSIGYSTCHWCNVMAHESFEDAEIADRLNRSFISVKVDREERPDIDNIYMAACQAITGSGGWPTSVFMTAEGKPFFAGTYFPKTSRQGFIGFKELLAVIADKWSADRAALLRSADEIAGALQKGLARTGGTDAPVIDEALDLYKRNFDRQYGGFGAAPKFPAAHNLLFLLRQYQKRRDAAVLEMAEKTLTQMYRGGLFDHVGFGFSRYSTDRYFLVPHFEKMLYDNALLILAYCEAYAVTGDQLYRNVAEKTAAYILREMTSPEGAFFSAQDADSDGEEGKYYLFRPEEITGLLGEEDGSAFNRYYDITRDGNFEGQSIPNLLHNDTFNAALEDLLPPVLAYRRQRTRIDTDDKILTAWNSLMIAAMCALYRISRREEYLEAARRAQSFIEKELCEGEALYVSFRDGRRGSRGFLDDYAYYVFALLALYEATLEQSYLDRALAFTGKAVADFFDHEYGGFYFYGRENESLFFRPKESYDGAMPSGNSVMAYDLVRLHYLTGDGELEKPLERQMDFMRGEAERYPAGYAMFLSALSDYLDPPPLITPADDIHIKE